MLKEAKNNLEAQVETVWDSEQLKSQKVDLNNLNLNKIKLKSSTWWNWGAD